MARLPAFCYGFGWVYRLGGGEEYWSIKLEQRFQTPNPVLATVWPLAYPFPDTVYTPSPFPDTLQNLPERTG